MTSYPSQFSWCCSRKSKTLEENNCLVCRQLWFYFFHKKYIVYNISLRTIQSVLQQNFLLICIYSHYISRRTCYTVGSRKPTEKSKTLNLAYYTQLPNIFLLIYIFQETQRFRLILNSTEVFSIAKQNLFDQNTKDYHYIGTEVQTAELYIKS